MPKPILSLGDSKLGIVPTPKTPEEFRVALAEPGVFATGAVVGAAYPIVLGVIGFLAAFVLSFVRCCTCKRDCLCGQCCMKADGAGSYSKRSQLVIRVALGLAVLLGTIGSIVGITAINIDSIFDDVSDTAQSAVDLAIKELYSLTSFVGKSSTIIDNFLLARDELISGIPEGTNDLLNILSEDPTETTISKSLGNAVVAINNAIDGLMDRIGDLAGTALLTCKVVDINHDADGGPSAPHTLAFHNWCHNNGFKPADYVCELDKRLGAPDCDYSGCVNAFCAANGAHCGTATGPVLTDYVTAGQTVDDYCAANPAECSEQFCTVVELRKMADALSGVAPTADYYPLAAVVRHIPDEYDAGFGIPAQSLADVRNAASTALDTARTEFENAMTEFANSIGGIDVRTVLDAQVANIGSAKDIVGDASASLDPAVVNQTDLYGYISAVAELAGKTFNAPVELTDMMDPAKLDVPTGLCIRKPPSGYENPAGCPDDATWPGRAPGGSWPADYKLLFEQAIKGEYASLLMSTTSRLLLLDVTAFDKEGDSVAKMVSRTLNGGCSDSSVPEGQDCPSESQVKGIYPTLAGFSPISPSLYVPLFYLAIFSFVFLPLAIAAMFNWRKWCTAFLWLSIIFSLIVGALATVFFVLHATVNETCTLLQYVGSDPVNYAGAMYHGYIRHTLGNIEPTAANFPSSLVFDIAKLGTSAEQLKLEMTRNDIIEKLIKMKSSVNWYNVIPADTKVSLDLGAISSWDFIFKDKSANLLAKIGIPNVIDQVVNIITNPSTVASTIASMVGNDVASAIGSSIDTLDDALKAVSDMTTFLTGGVAGLVGEDLANNIDGMLGGDVSTVLDDLNASAATAYVAACAAVGFNVAADPAQLSDHTASPCFVPTVTLENRGGFGGVCTCNDLAGQKALAGDNASKAQWNLCAASVMTFCQPVAAEVDAWLDGLKGKTLTLDGTNFVLDDDDVTPTGEIRFGPRYLAEEISPAFEPDPTPACQSSIDTIRNECGIYNDPVDGWKLGACDWINTAALKTVAGTMSLGCAVVPVSSAFKSDATSTEVFRSSDCDNVVSVAVDIALKDGPAGVTGSVQLCKNDPSINNDVLVQYPEFRCLTSITIPGAPDTNYASSMMDKWVEVTPGVHACYKSGLEADLGALATGVDMLIGLSPQTEAQTGSKPAVTLITDTVLGQLGVIDDGGDPAVYSADIAAMTTGFTTLLTPIIPVVGSFVHAVIDPLVDETQPFISSITAGAYQLVTTDSLCGSLVYDRLTNLYVSFALVGMGFIIGLVFAVFGAKRLGNDYQIGHKKCEEAVGGLSSRKRTASARAFDETRTVVEMPACPVAVDVNTTDFWG